MEEISEQLIDEKRGRPSRPVALGALQVARRLGFELRAPERRHRIRIILGLLAARPQHQLLHDGRKLQQFAGAFHL